MNKECIDFKQKLKLHIQLESEEYFGVTDDAWIDYATDYFWDDVHQNGRLSDLSMHGVVPGNAKVLDLAAGCGQFLFAALNRGYDCYGLEPEKWKLDFIRKKSLINGYPKDYAERVAEGVGESMPYQDNTYDCITSYQTLEHVQDPKKVIEEMIRVTKPMGVILIRCPDYRGTFEGHYRLPWLPLMPRWLAKLYLKKMGKPACGLDTIQYITEKKITKWIRNIEKRTDCRLILTDMTFILFDNALSRRGLPSWLKYCYPIYKIWVYICCIFKSEIDVNLVIRVHKK